MAILIVVNHRVALNAVDLPDKKTVDVEITASCGRRRENGGKPPV